MEAIASVLNQTDHNIEIIVVDDGSTDDTKAAIDSLRNEVHYFYQTNQGQSVARNLGIEKAKGEYIALLDSDDIWLPGKLDRDLAIFAQSDDIDCVIGNSEHFIGDLINHESLFDFKQIFDHVRGTKHFNWSLPHWEKGSICTTSAMNMKRQSLEKIGKHCFDPQLRGFEDWDVELRLYMYTTVVFYSDVLCRVRVFDDGTRLYHGYPGITRTEEELTDIKKTHLAIINRYINSLRKVPTAATRINTEQSRLMEYLA